MTCIYCVWSNNNTGLSLRALGGQGFSPATTCMSMTPGYFQVQVQFIHTFQKKYIHTIIIHVGTKEKEIRAGIQ